MSTLARARSLTYRARRRLRAYGDFNRPSRALFGGIRRRLTLWYSTVLAAVLLLSGSVLYLAVQSSLLSPLSGVLQLDANGAGKVWQVNYSVYQEGGPLPGSLCPQGGGGDPYLLIICFDTHGNITGEDQLFGSIAANGTSLNAFANPSLARSVAGGGSAGDTVATSATGEFASVQRFAKFISLPNGKGGVIQVGLPVGGQANALATLFRLLVFLGGLTVLLSLGAGLFLANRALQPARIAYARQRDFIADASHELRTPLTMLRSSVEFVLRGRDHLHPDDIALLEDTVEETTHLTSLANNMLNLARLDSDEIHVEEDVVNLSSLADEVARWAWPLAAERDIGIMTDSTAQALVLGDKSLLEQAVLVLVDNAIKYNHRGGNVTITTSAADGRARLEVSDTGIGVDPEHLRRLGERFYRVDKARTRESGGAGLGLSIVRSIVTRHEGTLHLESTPAEGTTAAILLPLIGRG